MGINLRNVGNQGRITAIISSDLYFCQPEKISRMTRKILAFVQQFKNEIIFVFFSFLALYLRIQRLAGMEIDGDALWQVSFFNGINSFTELIQNLPRADHAGYLAGDFVLIYPFFKIFGWNKWGLALPHLAATLIGFYFLYLLGRDHFKTIWGYIIAFLVMCFNENLIFHSVEIRAYAVMPALALMALYFSLQVVEKNVRMSWNEKLVAGLAFVIILWFHLYGIIMVFCAALYALLSHIRDKDSKLIIKETVKFFLLVLLVAMPLWIFSVFFAQKLDLKANFMARGIYTFEYIPNPFTDFIGFLRAIFGNLMGFKRVTIFGLAIKIKWLVNGILLAFLLPHRERFKQMGFSLILIVIPLQLLLLADLQNSYWFIQRQFVWVMAFYAFLLGWCWDSIATYGLAWVNKVQVKKK